MKSEPLHKDRLNKLLRLIKLINHVPKDGLPDLVTRRGPMPLEALIKSWGQQFSWLHSELQDFIGPISLQNEASQYRMLQQAAEAMRSLAVKDSKERKPGAELARFSVSLGVDSEGKIVRIPNHLLECLEGLEADRIRRCHCGHLFWAKRRDQTSCGPKCANVSRVRKTRGSQLYER